MKKKNGWKSCQKHEKPINNYNQYALRLMQKKNIVEWSEMPWNPVTGCNPVSMSSEHCYTKQIAIWCKSLFWINVVDFNETLEEIIRLYINSNSLR